MRNRRWSGDNDRHFWPFTLSTGDFKRWGFMIDSGAHEDGRGDCHIRLYLRGVTLICELPRLVPDYCVRHVAESWDAATIERLGRNWYEERHPREYGLFVSDGTLHAHYGSQTHDSTTTKGKCYFLPWRNWQHIRHSLYDLQGNHFWTEWEGDRHNWAAITAVKDACPKVGFEFEDFDGQRITATTHIEEREWHFGTGICRWLSWFTKPKIRRDLALEFSSEVGPEKGSWKGGTTGHSTDMLPGELHESAFKRYCEKEHRSKYRKFQIRYIGPVNAQTVGACD
jgi:hypothetical protein